MKRSVDGLTVNSCTWALLHLLNVWPKRPSILKLPLLTGSERGALRRSQEWRRSSLTHVGPKCDWVVFTRGVLWGRVGLGLGPSHFGAGYCITHSDDTYCLLPEERQVTGHTKDKGKGQKRTNSKTVLINSIEWQGRVWRHTLISAVHWRTHFSGWFVTQLDGWDTFLFDFVDIFRK